MEPLGNSPQQQLLDLLRGQSLVIPDLQLLFNHWPQAIHPELGRLRKDVDRRLETCVQSVEFHECQLRS